MRSLDGSEGLDETQTDPLVKLAIMAGDFNYASPEEAPWRSAGGGGRASRRPRVSSQRHVADDRVEPVAPDEVRDDMRHCLEPQRQALRQCVGRATRCSRRPGLGAWRADCPSQAWHQRPCGGSRSSFSGRDCLAPSVGLVVTWLVRVRPGDRLLILTGSRSRSPADALWSPEAL